LPRRSADDIGAVVEQIVELLRQHPEGLRAEQIREALSLQAKELPRPLNEAVAAGRLGKSGQKRATTYFVKGAGATRATRASSTRRSASAGGGKRRGSAAASVGKGATRRSRRTEKPAKVKAEKAEKVEEAAPVEGPPAT
jgi:hypothetical protein